MEKLRFFYIKEPDHKEILVDGAIGGVTADGSRISATFYTERNAVPQSVVHELKDGVLGDEVVDEREGKEGVVRLLQATVHMDLEKAKSVHKWLGDQIDQISKIRGGNDEPS